MIVVDSEPEVPRSTGRAREPLVEIDELVVEYPVSDGSVRAVDAVSLAIYPGEIVGLAGESGCGKSTVAHSLLRILQPPGEIAGGRVLFRDQDVLSLPASQLRKFRQRNFRSCEAGSERTSWSRKRTRPPAISPGGL